MKKILIVDAEPWSVEKKKIVRLSEILEDLLKKDGSFLVERIDIKPERKRGYFLGYVLAGLKSFKKILEKDFDVLFLPNCYLSFLTIVSKLKKKKSVVIFTDIYPNFVKKIKNEGFKFYALLIASNLFSKIIDKIVIPSFNEIKIGGLIGIQKHKINLIRNPVDTKCIKFDVAQRKKLRKKLGINNCFVIGYVGKLIEYYKIERIIHAISILSKSKKKKVVLLLVGEGPERKKLKQLSKRLNVKLVDVGFVQHHNLYKYYSAMDLFIYPINAIGIKLNEVMCVGIPVIASKGMAEEIVIEGKTGFLAKSPNPKDLAEKIEFVMSLRKNFLNKIAKNMRNFAEKNLSSETVLKKYKKLFE